MARVLVVDDDQAIRLTLERLLRTQRYDVVTATDGAEAIAAIRDGEIDAVLLDLGLPVMDGCQVLERVHGLVNVPPIIVVTAREDMDATVQCMQLGAYDYLVKPLEMEELKQLVRRAVRTREATQAARASTGGTGNAPVTSPIVGQSAAMREVYKTIGAVSTSRASVLICGESGTGKELVARAIHLCGPDRDKPFVAVNCTALSRELVASELFGHVRGAFTSAIRDHIGRFELAADGTHLLDEIGDAPLDVQPKLLRVLQERAFERVGSARPIALHARIIAATNGKLESLVRAGRFRSDLYYRLRVVEIELPPLRERMDDLPLLVESLLCKINREQNKHVTRISPDALEQLRQHDWPGNVRELENTLTRAVVLARGHVLECELLSVALAQTPSSPRPAGDIDVLSLREVERRHIARTLLNTRWNKRRACALLQISRPTLDRKIEAFNLKPESS